MTADPKELEDGGFFKRYYMQIPIYCPQRRQCRFCDAQEELDIDHHWNCLNPDCKSYKLKAKIDADIRRRAPNDR